jgi:polysaccharide biosynthesis protein PslH
MPPSPNGLGAIPLVLNAELSALRERHDVTLVTVAGPQPHEWDAVEQLQASGLEVHHVRRDEPTAFARGRRWVHHSALWLGSRTPMRTIWFHRTEVQRILDRLLAERRFDLVHVEDNAMGVYRFPRHVPSLFTEHEVRVPRSIDWAAWRRGGAYRGILDEIDWHRWTAYHRMVWSSFDCIQVFSQRDARMLRRIAPELGARVRVNPFPVEIPACADPAREEEGTIVFTGSFLHPPNVDAARWLVRDIMPRLRARYPGVKLRIVGSDPRGALRGLELEDVELCGWVPDIEAAIARAAVVMAPVRVGGGQRMKVLLAMAMGKAVVTTPRGMEGLMDGGAAEPPVACGTTAAEIADLTVQLLRDRERRHELGVRARAMVMEHHDVSAYGRRIDAAYASLIERRHAPQEVGA